MYRLLSCRLLLWLQWLRLHMCRRQRGSLLRLRLRLRCPESLKKLRESLPRRHRRTAMQLAKLAGYKVTSYRNGTLTRSLFHRTVGKT